MKRRPRNKTARYRSYARKVLIVAILLSVALLFTWTYVRTALLTALIRVSRGETGTLADTVSGEALFAGGSAPVTAPAPGAVKFLVESGQSVRMGQVIAEVGAPATAAAFEESLAFAREKLALYERETEDEFRALMSRVQPSYEKAVQLFFEMQEGYAQGDVKGAREAEEALLGAGSAISADRERLLQIEAERARLHASVESIAAAQKASTVQVLAPASGIFVAEVSEIDAQFAPEELAKKDATQLLALSRQARDARKESVKNGQTVGAGDLLGKVHSGQNVVFYLPIKTENRPDLRSGREVEVTFTSSGQKESGVITSVEDGKPPGYSVITGEMSRVALDSLVRSTHVSLLIRSHSGIVVPRSALLEKDGKTGVLAVQKTYARFVPVEVLMTQGDRAVVRGGISPSDEIVTRALKFLEGKRVR
ncbi:MAG: HlyD family efflux transporter periplasmic adaptor subunit [Bacillota bacterium]